MDATPSAGLSTAVGFGSGGVGYPDSVESSPRSRGGESWDEPFSTSAAPNSKLRLMCSYGGHIVPRPHDKSLCYLGGDTRIVVVERHTSLAELSTRLSSLVGGRSFSLKYQLPSEDLDSLISVSTEEDFDNMIEEYDRIASASSHGGSGSNSGSSKSSRLRLFLFPAKVESAPSSIGSILDDSKSETWFVDALNGAIGMGSVLPRGLSGDSAASSVNYLLGLDYEASPIVPPIVVTKSSGGGACPVDHLAGGEQNYQDHKIQLLRPDSTGKLGKHGHEVHSVPDSPMMETASSFGSTSSVALPSNLPPIRVKPDDQSSDHRGYNGGGLEEQMSHMNVATNTPSGGQRQDDSVTKDEGFIAVHPQLASSVASANPVPSSLPIFLNPVSPSENLNAGVLSLSSDDERSDHMGMRKPLQPPLPQQPKTNNAFDMPTSDRIPYYPERTSPVVTANWSTPVPDTKQEVPSSMSDSNYRGPMQYAEQSYVLPVQTEQQQQQQQPQKHQQYIQATPRLIPHHPSNQNPQLVQHHPSNAMPSIIPYQSYYQMHNPMQSQHQLPQTHPYNSQIPVYFVPVPQNQAYNVSMQQPNIADGTTITTIKSSSSIPNQMLPSRVVSPQKPELMAASALTNVYRTNATTPAAPMPQQSPSPQLIHMTDPTHQFMSSFHQLHPHQSQSPAVPAYGYEFANQVHTHPVYYTQASSTPMPSNYQTINSKAAMVPDSQTQSQQQQLDLKQTGTS